MISSACELGRIRTQFLLENEREPNAQELAGLAKCNLKQAQQYLGGRGHVASLDEIRDGEDHHLAMFIPDEHAPDPEATAVWKAQQCDIHAALNHLTERERDVITRRFGLGGSKSENLEAIGQVFDITRERVRQIETEALRKLARGSSGVTLRAYFDQDTRVEQDV